jgi:copper chaperone
MARGSPRLALAPYTPTRYTHGVGEVTFLVAGMSCDHCKSSVIEELSQVDGVADVDVDLDTKLVRVRGTALDDARLVAAIDEAGYDAVRA